MPHINPRRNKAFLIDSVIAVTFFVSPFLVVDFLPSSIAGHVAISGLVLGLVYTIFRDGVRGQSIGKRIFKIQVIRKKSKKPIGFGMAFLRGLLTSLPIIGWIDFVLIYFTPNSQRISDKVLGLQLVSIKK